MSRRDDRISMRQIPDSARKAMVMAAGRHRTDLDREEMLQLALTRAVEVIGEAAGRVSEAPRDQHAAIPWRDLVAMRG